MQLCLSLSTLRMDHLEQTRLANLRQAYIDLERRVQRALNTQVGDVGRLSEVQSEVLSYIQAVEQVCQSF
jgi:hypothetical protein